MGGEVPGQFNLLAHPFLNVAGPVLAAFCIEADVFFERIAGLENVFREVE